MFVDFNEVQSMIQHYRDSIKHLWYTIKPFLTFAGGFMALAGALTTGFLEYKEHRAPNSVTTSTRPKMLLRIFALTLAFFGGFLAMVGSKVDSNEQIRLHTELEKLNKETLATVTGDGSFPVYMVTVSMNGVILNSPLPLDVEVVGDFPMYDANAEIQQSFPGIDPQSKEAQLQSFHRIPLGTGNLQRGFNPSLNYNVAAPGRYFITTTARNGYFNETLDIVQCGGGWDQDIVVNGWGKELKRIAGRTECRGK
jgi:hypothetical protein